MTAYARSVVDGDVRACRLVGLAAERHLRDLVDGPARGLRWDPKAAQHAIDFYPEFLVLEEDQPFVLQPWQQFNVGSIAGWFRGDAMRFDTWYCETPKGQGKSPCAGGYGLYQMSFGAANAQIYAAAVTKDQASIPWEDAAAMVLRSPELAARFVVTGWEPGKKPTNGNIAYEQRGSFFRPISSEKRGLDGKRVQLAIIEELQEHRTPVVVVKMRLGTKGRRNALIIMITNSGYDRHSVCWQERDRCVRILEGRVTNDAVFAWITQLDACADCRAKGREFPQDGCSSCDSFTDPEVWIKAAPNLGVSIQREYLAGVVLEAQQKPAMRNEVLRLNFGIWPTALSRWFSPEEWARGNAPVDLHKFIGRPCVIGIDASKVNDLTAMVLLCPDDEFFVEIGELPENAESGDEPPVAAVSGGIDMAAWFWCPEDGLRQRCEVDGVPYDLWRDEKSLVQTPGNTIDLRYLRRQIKDLRAMGILIAKVGADEAYMHQTLQDLQDEDGFDVVPIPQTFRMLNAPSFLLETLVRSGSLRHGGNKPMAWCAANVVKDTDAGERIKPSKGKSTERIDGIAAVVTGLKLIGFAATGGPSVYDNGGILFL